MKTIKLSRGFETIVDDADYGSLIAYRWHCTQKGYAARTKYVSGKVKTFLMHREILGTPTGLETDHINQNKLDNRRANLRVVNGTQNQINVSPPKRHNKVGFRGVNELNGRFFAKVKVGGKYKHLGGFSTPEAAHAAYLLGKQKIYGEFAPLV